MIDLLYNPEDYYGALLYWLILWIPLILLLWRITVRSRLGSVGLPLAYLSSIIIAHLPGAFVYLNREYVSWDFELVYNGLVLTSIGAIGFFSGVWLTGGIIGSLGHIARLRMIDPRFLVWGNMDLSKLLINIGLFTLLILWPLLGTIPTISTLLTGLKNAFLVGICLGIWRAFVFGNSRKLRVLLSLALLFPLFTLVFMGFLGAGIGYAMLIYIFFFAMRQAKLRWHIILTTPVILFLGLSLYSSYVAQRTDIRAVVWQGNATIVDRLQAGMGIFDKWQWFNPEDVNHLEHLDQRLNQNVLVGAAVRHIGRGYVDYASGETLITAFIAIIPRAIWPSKPQIAGGNQFVSKFTGMEFDENTSVGGGPIFEFFVNFGALGVFLGMLVIGAMIRVVDAEAIFSLRRGDQRGFLVWFLPGIAFIGALSELAILVAAVLSSLGSALIILWVAGRHRPVRPV